MDKSINLKFLNTESNNELYNWLSKQSDVEGYIKSILSKTMMEEKNNETYDIGEVAKEVLEFFNDCF